MTLSPIACSLDALNAAHTAAFIHALDGVFEHAPWVAGAVAGARPFASVAALHAALMGAVRAAPPADRIAFLGGHPELGVGVLPDSLTAESRVEQAALGLATVTDAEEVAELNRAYRGRFGFPFIICARRHTADSVLRAFRERLERPPTEELAAAVEEVGHITRLRLVARVTGPGMPATEGALTTHVLDTASGRPAQGVRVALLAEGRALGAWETDADGRTGDRLLSGGPLRMGRYELRFQVGAYFAARGVASFLDAVPVCFLIDAAEAHYHIPLLVAPFGYSSYRGS